MATIPKSHEELKEQYAAALRLWSDAHSAYPFSSPEVVAANKLVEELERQLKTFPPQPRLGSKS